MLNEFMGIDVPGMYFEVIGSIHLLWRKRSHVYAVYYKMRVDVEASVK